MTPNESFQLYVCVKLHFSSKTYDAVKYNWKVSRKINLQNRNDKYYFEKLAKHREPKNLLIANLVQKPSMWIGDILSPEGNKRYREMTGRWQNLTYIFSEDLKKLDDNLKQNLVVKEGQHPNLLRLYLQKKVCLETVVILNNYVKLHDYWSKKLSDPVWKSLQLPISRYGALFTYDITKTNKIILRRFNNNER